MKKLIIIFVFLFSQISYGQNISPQEIDPKVKEIVCFACQIAQAVFQCNNNSDGESLEEMINQIELKK